MLYRQSKVFRKHFNKNFVVSVVSVAGLYTTTSFLNDGYFSGRKRLPMNNKYYTIVTGASPSSIGFHAAQKLASKQFGYKVILACRSEQKGKEAEQLIRAADPDSDVLYMPLDLASFESIHGFVDDFRALLKEDASEEENCFLKVLVNNAGVGYGRTTPYAETKDGLEEIVGVNHYGTFLLTQLLMNDLKQTPGGSRVVVVSSSLHQLSPPKAVGTDEDSDGNCGSNNQPLLLPNFPDGLLQSSPSDAEGNSNEYDGKKAYRVSKLCNLWYTYELQRRIREEDGDSTVTVNAISPGFIPTTGLTRRAGRLGVFFLHYILDPWRYTGYGITRSPAEGAEVIVQAATSPVASKGGQYFHLPKGQDSIEARPSSDESMDEDKAKQLWDISLKVCQLR